LIAVTPKSTAVLSGGMEYVQITLKTNSAYKLSPSASARVFITEEVLTFDAWRTRYFPGSTSDLAAFAISDPGQLGVTALQRYAFGLNPTSPQLFQGAPAYKVSNGRLQVAYRNPVSVTQVEYVVEVSDDLAAWNTG